MKFAGVFALFAAADAGTVAVTWSDCGAQHATVTDLQPLQVQLGSTQTLTGTGTVDEDITSAFVTATAYASGVKIVSCSGDGTVDIVCKLPLGAGQIAVKALDFPIAAGTVTIEAELTTSSLLPSSLAKTHTEVRATEQNGEDLICLDLDTQQQSVDVEFGCSGTADPAGPGCYEGSAGALGLTETVKVNLLEVNPGAGKLEFVGSGITGFTCSDKTYTKSDLDVTVSDLSDCLPSGVEVSKVQYCSDDDTLKVTVKDTAVPLPVTATLKNVACNGFDSFATCTGDADPVVSEAQCYRGTAGALGLTETVTIKVTDFVSSAGHVDLSGEGIEAFTCAGKSVTKSGQDIALEDSSDCLPSGIEVSGVKYCSDSDTMKITVIDQSVPLPISAIASRIECPASVEV